MITKCIHDDFELDLSAYEITITEENQWFSDRFFTKYSFPIDVDLSDALNETFGQLLDMAVEEPTTYYEVFLFMDDTHAQAILEVLEVVDRRASIQISFGFEQFPNWNKKLAELPLQVINVGEALAFHAEDIIDKTWPAVNYNFVQVHTPRFDPGTERWNGFEGIVNHYRDGAFLLNEFDVEENIIYNRNVMIPMAYYMHVLVQGFADAGYQLQGDVLQDADLLKMLFYKEAEEYINANIDGFEYEANINSFDSMVTVVYRYGAFNINRATRQLAVYNDTIAFTKRGRYKISGVVYLRRQFSDARAEIYYKGQLLKRYYADYIRQNSWSETVRYVDINVDVDDINQTVSLQNRQLPNAYINEQLVDDAILWDLTITPLAIYDENGELVPPVINSEKVDLTKVVPDVSFGDFVTAIKNWKNMDIKIQGNVVRMDYIEPQMEVNEVVDLRRYDQRAPRRRFKQGDDYRLKFKDISAEGYAPESMYISVHGATTDPLLGDEETKSIEINAVPFPLRLLNNVETAYAVDDGKGKITAVLYAGAVGVANLAEDPEEIMVPRIYEKHYARWVPFRIKSQSFTTNFNADALALKEVTVQSKVIMYNKLFLVRSITKTDIIGTFQKNYELELESLK